jgi:hypothetical protein
MAVLSQSAAVVQCLLETKADSNAICESGYPMLLHAYPKENVVRIPLQYGAHQSLSMAHAASPEQNVAAIIYHGGASSGIADETIDEFAQRNGMPPLATLATLAVLT